MNKALENNDGAAAHYSFVQPVDDRISKQLSGMIELTKKYQTEMDYTNGIPKELMGFEIEHQIK